MKLKNKARSILSALLAVTMFLSAFSFTIFAAQVNEYTDPADSWIEANGRTNELDLNATTTYETQYCFVCDKETTTLTYRVPEYTRSGETALNRGVKYSDGANYDGSEFGNLDDGTPGVDATYTGHHWTKSVCQTCGTINALEGPREYNYCKNLYSLNACDNNFFMDFDNTTYTPYNSIQHTTVLKEGEYCQYCRGTYAQAVTKREAHDFDETVDGQIGNNRFYISRTCTDCGYETSEYVVAKSVVTSYYGEADGEAHTLTVTDLSENGVNTRIRYGTEAGNCNRTSAPNYTQAGYYSVYYEIDYTYAGETMTENGVGYVWLLAAEEEDTANGTIIVLPVSHEHDYHYLETVKPSCEDLGYDRFQCNGCGDLIKTNYVPALGHTYKDVLIREATCIQNGMKLHMCNACGDFYEDLTPLDDHTYEKHTHDATCKSVGYDEYVCTICDDNYINNIKPLVEHRYRQLVRKPGCEEQGYTNYICEMCNAGYVSDYVDATGHAWDEGRTVTTSGCTSEGVIEYTCTNDNCREKMIIATDATGHTPGAEATCTESQICDNCGTILELPKGHAFSSVVIDATCTQSGYTIHSCENCTHSYLDSYTHVLPHDYEVTVTDARCIAMGYSTYSCHNCDAEYVSDYTDKLEHDYAETKTTPSCTKMGFTTFICEDCGDTYKAEYVEQKGHTPSDWIIDVPATIENSGSKHVECSECGETLQTAEITQLIDADRTDEDGAAEIGDFSIILTDKNGTPIFNSEIVIDVEDKISIKLPGGRLLDFADQTTVTVFYTENQKPKADLAIDIVDANGNKATGATDENGQLVVPNNKTNTGDDNGTIGRGEEEKETYVVSVTDKLNAIIPNCEVYIGESNHVVVDLPDGFILTKESPTIITITNQNGEPQKDVSVIVIADKDYIEKGLTDRYGKLTVPPVNSGYTDKDGKVYVNGFHILVTDEKDVITNAFVKIEDGKVYITLPDTHTLTTSDQVTATIADKDGQAVSGVSVTMTDKNNNSKSGTTNSSGKVTLPVKSSVGGGGSSSSGGNSGGGGGYYSSTTVTVKDKDNKTVSVTKSVSTTKATLTLPTGKKITDDNYYTITVTSSGKAKAGYTVVLKDRSGNAVTGTTDKNGVVMLPGKKHSAYIFGYPDSTFRPDGDMTRSEAAAIFARLIAEEKGEKISGTSTDFKDISKNAWYASYVSYLEKYGIIKGYTDNTFRPDNKVTRAEFIAMTVRYYDLFNDVKYTSTSVKYTDVSSSYWAVKEISYAKNIGWLNGYADGTFRGDNNITRAEVVTVVNRATGRNADKECVNENYTKLNRFIDVTDNSEWYFYDVAESANEHIGITHSDGETWSK